MSIIEKIYRDLFTKDPMTSVSFRVIQDLFAPSRQVIVLLVHTLQLIGLIYTCWTSCRTIVVISSIFSWQSTEVFYSVVYPNRVGAQVELLHIMDTGQSRLSFLL